jgi:type I restriction enzyme S subunit
VIHNDLSVRQEVPFVALGQVTSQAPTFNPAHRAPEDDFIYVDLSAIDQDQKTINGARTVLGAEAPSRARQVIRTGDVLVSTVRPNLNGVALVSREHDGAIASTGFCVLRPNAELLNSNFLFHWVRSNEFIGKMVRQATGASYPAVTDGIVRASQIPLASLPEQRRIAAILDQVDALRAKRRQTLTQLDEMARAVFIDMFGDPTKNEKNWRKVRFDSKFEFKNGINFSSEQRGRGILTVDVLNMYSEDIYIKTDDLYRVDVPMNSDRLLVPGDLLFVRSSVKPEGIAWPSIFFGMTEPVSYCGFLIRARPKSDTSELVPRYMVHFLRQDGIRGQLISKAGKVAITNINQERLGSLEIAIPPRRLQEQFSERAQALEELRSRQKTALKKEDVLFSSLQHRAFRGEL